MNPEISYEKNEVDEVLILLDTLEKNMVKDLEEIALKDASVISLGDINKKGILSFSRKKILTNKDLLDSFNGIMEKIYEKLFQGSITLMMSSLALFVLSCLTVLVINFSGLELGLNFAKILDNSLSFFSSSIGWILVFQFVVIVLSGSSVLTSVFNFFNNMRVSREEKNARMLYKNLDINLTRPGILEKKVELYGFMGAMQNYVKETIDTKSYLIAKEEEIEVQCDLQKDCVNQSSLKMRILGQVFAEGKTILGDYKFRVQFYNRKNEDENHKNLRDSLIHNLNKSFSELEDKYLKEMDNLLNSYLKLLAQIEINEKYGDKVNPYAYKKLKDVLIEFSVIYSRFFMFMESGKNLVKENKLDVKEVDVDVNDLHMKMKDRINSSNDYKLNLLKSIGKSNL